MAHDHDHGEESGHAHEDHEEDGHDHGGHGHGHGHAHGHGHGHAHGHGHHHHDGAKGRAFAIGVALNLTFVGVEAVYGILSHSVSLLSDAAHNMGDVMGLLLAWGAATLARRKPSRTRTYGLRRSTVLAALANALILVLAVGGVLREAVLRFRDPSQVEGKTVIVVAILGALVNGASALLFMSGRKKDANVRAAFMHLVADAAVSVGVAIGGVALWLTGSALIDPVVSVIVSLVILYGTWGILKEAVNLALDAVPSHIDPDAVRAFLTKLPGVSEVHDLHIWAMSTTEVALTAHLVMPGQVPPRFLVGVGAKLKEKFEIGHATVQIEPGEIPEERCSAPCVAE
jgi:cobalt-zinc-cadmium efflux system protein